MLNKSSMLPASAVVARSGDVCRDFTEVTYRNGQESDREGTACRQSDGNWHLE